MNQAERLDDIRARMRAARLDALIALHDGSHFIETPNPVMAVTGFKALAASAGVLRADGEMSLIVTPAWDADRARERCPGVNVVGADDVIAGISRALTGDGAGVGLAGCSFAAIALVRSLSTLFPRAVSADPLVDAATRIKTDAEIANAREATRIAELGYARMLEIVRPGLSEDELAVELKWYTRTLGAEDDFLLLSSSPHNRAVAPSNGRRLAAGDIVVAEITPSVNGQLAQICRTLVLGAASAELHRQYDLVIESMRAGFRAAQPGAPMAEVCRAMNAVLEAQGYAEFCHPPHIKRRGHGLGFGAIEPGDVSLDNTTPLAPGMLFMIHPNQYLPETGYLLCGEPALMTERGAVALTRQQAALAEIAC